MNELQGLVGTMRPPLSLGFGKDRSNDERNKVYARVLRGYFPVNSRVPIGILKGRGRYNYLKVYGIEKVFGHLEVVNVTTLVASVLNLTCPGRGIRLDTIIGDSPKSMVQRLSLDLHGDRLALSGYHIFDAKA